MMIKINASYGLTSRRISVALNYFYVDCIEKKDFLYDNVKLTFYIRGIVKNF